MVKFKRIELLTVKDYDKVDRLINNGWKAVSGGMFSVLLEKRTFNEIRYTDRSLTAKKVMK